MGLVIIYLYNSTVTDFTYNGQPLNKAYEVIVDRTINDSFFVTFNHPLDDKGIYKTIEKDKIVKVHTPEGMQPFRVMDRVKYMDHVSIEAWPLFYADMRNKLVKPLMIKGASGQAAVNTFVNNLLINTPFTFTSNITDAHDYHTQDTEERENNPNQLYNALDVFKDIVTRWNGELVINGYDIRLLGRLGKNTGALLYEKKNISDFTDEESIQDVTTRLYGKSEWTERPEGSGEEIKHEISVKVESPLINAYSGIVFEKQYTNNDIRTEKEMKDWLNLKFTTDNIDKPSRNIKVNTNIVDDTVINLGDSLVLKYVKHDVDMEIRMVGYTYDGYANRYITVQLGDAKQSYVGNVQNTVKEIETNVNTNVKQTVNQILNANGERMIYSVTEPVGNFKNGDVWFDQQGGMYFWDEESGMWIDHPYNQNMNVVADKVEEVAEKADEAVQSANDADVRANEAIEKAGANANLLTTHQNTLNDIKNTTLPDINKSLSDAMKEAKSALSSASSAMDEAKKADGKIADYVTKNGLVNGTTVDSKIDEATGEISKKITTVESKIPTEIGGTNLLVGSAEMKLSPEDSHYGYNYLLRPNIISIASKVKVGDTLTFSFDIWSEETTGIRIYDTNGNPSMEFGSETIIATSDKKRVSFTKKLVASSKTNSNMWYMDFYNEGNGIKFWVENIKIEKGTIPTDWSPAPEDNYTQEEFAIFESTYKEDVKGINSSLTDLSNKKLDGTTYTTFYNNEYKKTAQGVTDTYTKVNKIIDANGNSTDAFAKAVYDRNATRQSADFQNVTKNLVQTATYTAGINGVKQSITSIRGDLDKLSVGGRNLIDESMITSTVSTFDKSEYVTKGLITYSSSGGTTGLRINASKLEPNTDYVMSYKYQKTGGTLLSFGGHTDRTFDNNLAYVDGSTDGVSYANNGSVYVNNDTKIHSVVVKFTTPDTVTPTDLIYIQPNRISNSSVSVNIFDWKLEKGTIPTDWSPAPEDMLGKADFQVFKGTYESNDQTIKNRLTAIDSGKEGSILYNTNTALSTAKGNTKSITTLDTKVNNLKVGGRNYFKNSDVERTGSREFVNHSTWDMSPVINEFGTDTYYTVSFDIKSKVAGNINVYAQNGNGTKYSIGTKGINVSTSYQRFSYTFKPTLSSSTETMSMLAFYGNYGSGRIPTIKNVKFEVGNFATDWTPATEDMLGKDTFTLFKNDYEDTAKSVERRLTAIDSSAEGSVVTRLNKTESTASGNSQLISTINKNYVKQGNIDASILADKKIKDTRSTNQLPSWYFTNYPLQEVREFKQVPTMGIGSGTYGILTTNVPWRDDSGGTVKQKFETNTETHVRQSNSAGTAWGAWSKQIDTADTTYQKITQTSSLYERVIGSTEANVKNNMARIVMADSVFKTEVIDKTNVDDSNTFSSSTNLRALSNMGALARDENLAPNGFRATGANSGNGSFRLEGVITSNGWWTVSGWARGSQNDDMKFAIDICDSPHSKQFGLGTKNEWQYFEFSHNVTNYSSARNFVDFNSIAWAYYYFKDIKVEKNHHATAWTPSAIDFATQSNITQLSDNINLKVSKGDLLSQINVQAGGVLIQSGTNKLNITPETTYIQDATIKSAMIESLEADKIKTGTLDAGKVKVINIDAENITSNITDFIKSNWNEATGGGVTITGAGVRAINSEGSRVTLENGVVSVGNRAGVNLGFFGDHVLNKDATGTMTITASHGTETAFISATGTDGITYKRSMSIMAGAGEIDMFTTLDMNKNSLKDVTDIGFTGGHIKGNISGSARYMTIDAGTGTAFDIAGVTRMSITSVVNIFSGIDMRGKDIASVGKLTYNSDQRLKTNIKDTNIRALDAIRNWQLVSYDWLESGEHVEIGLIAQNSPEVMTYNEENDIYGIDAGKQTMINTLAIQQLDSKTNDEIAQLKAQVASLQDELALLKGD